MFTVLWSILVYIPMAHWVWGGGFLQQMGAIDFAGGTWYTSMPASQPGHGHTDRETARL